MDAETLRQRLTDLEDIFSKIRDHPKTPLEIRGIADHGQGRVATLKAVLLSDWGRTNKTKTQRASGAKKVKVTQYILSMCRTTPTEGIHSR